MIKLFIGAALTAASSVAAMPTDVATIASCYDGDTCTSTAGEKIRLACFDTPELRGRRAEPIPAREARDFLRRMVVGKTVRIERHTTDRYGRTVADLYVYGAPVGELMVSSGRGQLMPRYAHQCSWARRVR